MKINPESLDIENVGYELEKLRALAVLLCDYFKSSQEYVEENTYDLTRGYWLYGSLAHTIMDVIDDAREMADILIEADLKRRHSAIEQRENAERIS